MAEEKLALVEENQMSLNVEKYIILKLKSQIAGKLKENSINSSLMANDLGIVVV